MAILINVNNLSKSIAHKPLFQNIRFGLETGDRVGLVGPNGAGKSTLMKILAGLADYDSGQVAIQRGLQVGYLAQVPDLDFKATIEDTVLGVIPDLSDWRAVAQAHEIISKLSLGDTQRLVGDLSGGWQKRVALARELSRQPELLLLDEPTNHLDIESILWLEEFLAQARFATVTVTHDRVFLQKVSNRILELDRRNPNGLLNIKGTYIDYLEAKEQLMSSQELQEQKLRNTLRRETEWLRRGAIARQTKQKGRIQAAGVLKETVEDLKGRNLSQTVDLEFKSFERSPKKLIEAKEISKSYQGQLVIPSLNLLITPKTRLGLIGSNGCGKSTLIKLLLGTEPSDTGTVNRAEAIEISYFEQNRESLNPNESVFRTICPYGDYVDFGGQKIHAKSYLSRFLFDSLQMEQPVGKLSGGEQARLLLARLMLIRANILVLDEPTNDLDIQTMEVLKEVLSEFQGAIILVTHDRYFLDQISNQILGFGVRSDGQKVIETFADVYQWERWREGLMEESSAANLMPKRAARVGPKERTRTESKVLKEIEKIESLIAQAESEIAELSSQMENPKILADAEGLLEISKKISELQTQLNAHFRHWEQLQEELLKV